MRIITILTLSLVLVAASSAAESDKPEHQFIDDLEMMLELDPNDDEAINTAVAQIYLQCAAFYYAMSDSMRETRPRGAKLYNDTANWHKLVGLAKLTGKDKPIRSQETYANAYIERYTLDSVLEYSEADFKVKLNQCNASSLQDHGDRIIAGLEPP